MSDVPGVEREFCAGGATTAWVDFPYGQTCPGLFKEAALAHPEAIAVVDDGEHSPDGVPVQLTYTQLLDKAQIRA